MNKLPERIRIKDIARLADVSVGTVDRVLHGRRLLDRCGDGDEKSRRNLFGFPHHPVRDVL